MELQSLVKTFPARDLQGFKNRPFKHDFHNFVSLNVFSLREAINAMIVRRST